MATVALTIPEADVQRVKEAAEALTGLQTTEAFKPTAKELLTALIKRSVIQWERETHAFTPPGVT